MPGSASQETIDALSVVGRHKALPGTRRIDQIHDDCGLEDDLQC